MPVVGHAVAGWALAVLLGRSRRDERCGKCIPEVLWIPTFVVLAYLPDIVSQALTWTGVGNARRASHSIAGGAAAVAISALAARGCHISPRRIAEWAGLSAVVHIALDVMMSGGVTPFWPLHLWSIQAADGSATNLFTESAFSAIVAAVLLAIFSLLGAGERATLTAYRGIVVAMPIVALAAVTHHLRDGRNAALLDARTLAAAGRCTESLAELEEAARWPHPTRPGRIAHLAAECQAHLGNLSAAERLYQQSYSEDPDYFWAVADLAVFRARKPEPLAERRQKVAPLLSRLEHEFREQPQLDVILARIRTALN